MALTAPIVTTAARRSEHMARVSELTERESIAEAGRAAFDAIAASRKGVRGPFAVLMHSPELAKRTAEVGAYIRFESTLSDTDRELATLVAAQEFECAYEWAAHSRIAREQGLRVEAIEAIASGAELDAFTAEEATIVRFVREIARTHRVTDEAFEAVRARLGDQGAVELAAAAGYYAMLSFALNALEVVPPENPE
jgi:4-carboxymuconolactone decarboxylase